MKSQPGMTSAPGYTSGLATLTAIFQYDASHGRGKLLASVQMTTSWSMLEPERSDCGSIGAACGSGQYDRRASPAAEPKGNPL